MCLSVYDCDIKGIGTSTPLGEAQGKECKPLLGTLVFLMQALCLFLFVCVCLSVCDCDIKGTGTSTPLGEAQGKELQPLLGTLVFLM